MAAGFDTLTTAKRLKEAGFTEPQAEALSAAIADSRQFDLTQLATKADLAELRTEFERLRVEFERLRVDFERLHEDVGAIDTRLDQMATKAELAQQHASIVKWLAGLLITQAATMILVIVALVTFLRAVPSGHP